MMCDDENMTLPGEVAPLPPEVKINMKLDDIIKHEKMRAAVSHNLQFRNGNRNNNNRNNNRYRGGRRRNYPYRRPHFWRKKFRSQNWRLGWNGPNTPAYRQQQVRAFLEKKWRAAPLNSVFRRLGWTPAQGAARYKLNFAMNYRPYSQQFPFQRKFNNQMKPDPDRVKKLIASRKQYSSWHGLNPEDLESYSSNQDVQPLSAVNLRKLSQALGGHVTSYKEETSDTGTVITAVVSKSSVLGSHAFAIPNPMMAQRPAYNSGMSSASSVSGRSVFSQLAVNSANNGYAVQSLNNYGMNNQMSGHSLNNYAVNNQMPAQSFNTHGMNYQNHQMPMNQMSMNQLNGFHQQSNQRPMSQQNGFRHPSGTANQMSNNTMNGANYISFSNPIQNKKPQTVTGVTNQDLQSEIRALQGRDTDTPPPLVCSQTVRNGFGISIHTTDVSCSSRFAGFVKPQGNDEAMDT